MAFHSSGRQQRARHFSNLYFNTEKQNRNPEISYTEDDRFVSINISAAKEKSPKKILFQNPAGKSWRRFNFSFRPKPDKRRLPEEISKNNPAQIGHVITIASSSGGETISGKVFNIIQVIESSGDVSVKIPRSRPSSGLASHWNGTLFQKKYGRKTFGLASSFIKLADKKKLPTFSTTKAVFRPTAREALAKLPNESLKSMWTFIADQDLEKTGNAPKASSFWQNNENKNPAGASSVFVLIWQSKKKSGRWFLLNRKVANRKKK